MPKGTITLSILMQTYPKWISIIVVFLVVKVLFAYNAIILRPSLKIVKAVVFTYHHKVKFLTKHRVREVKGDQVVTKECNFNSVRNQD